MTVTVGETSGGVIRATLRIAKTRSAERDADVDMALTVVSQSGLREIHRTELT